MEYVDHGHMRLTLLEASTRKIRNGLFFAFDVVHYFDSRPVPGTAGAGEPEGTWCGCDRLQQVMHTDYMVLSKFFPHRTCTPAKSIVFENNDLGQKRSI